ncbi:hypothetical protein BB559_001136 [Furculomyces boomerangus]|uniref:Mitochondrial distribution and morphology protein 35 n=2 Tax=Harpellales TaxID=61421 RepID=A0A2T9Z310_9FUNG|nr:hypothetical protein BB559_001136 [Furculomyces boomerangus]PVZ99659.1 hypothetical protein BB558_004302 [Smittium angustum]
MESMGSECTPLKKEYDDCFNKWYSEKFLKGEKTDDCQELFKKYRICINSVLAKNNLTKMISEARPLVGSTFPEPNDPEISEKNKN